MQRRGLLGAMLAAAMAPAAIKAGVLMPVRTIWTPPQGLILWGDGIHDDTAALQAAFDGKPVHFHDGQAFAGVLSGSTFRVTNTLIVNSNSRFTLTQCHFWGEGMGHKPMLHFPLQGSYVPTRQSRNQ